MNDNENGNDNDYHNNDSDESLPDNQAAAFPPYPPIITPPPIPTTPLPPPPLNKPQKQLKSQSKTTTNTNTVAYLQANITKSPQLERLQTLLASEKEGQAYFKHPNTTANSNKNNKVLEECYYPISTWWQQISVYYDFSLEVRSAASFYLIKYLNNTNGGRGNDGKIMSKKRFQLIAMSCYNVAMKINESRPLRPSVFASLSRSLFTEADISSFDLLLIESLSWSLHPPSSASFCTLYVSLLQEVNKGRMNGECEFLSAVEGTGVHDVRMRREATLYSTSLGFTNVNTSMEMTTITSASTSASTERRVSEEVVDVQHGFPAAPAAAPPLVSNYDYELLLRYAGANVEITLSHYTFTSYRNSEIAIACILEGFTQVEHSNRRRGHNCSVSFVSFVRDLEGVDVSSESEGEVMGVRKGLRELAR